MYSNEDDFFDRFPINILESAGYIEREPFGLMIHNIKIWYDGRCIVNERIDGVIKGEIVTEGIFIYQEDVLESDINYKYISIPISDLSYPTCNKLKRGDKVTVYYTAKNKDVSSAIKDKQRLYSNTEKEGLVTCLLFETVEVISIHDSTGKETKENLVTDILVRLNKEDAMLIANLKSKGVFDIVLNKRGE